MANFNKLVQGRLKVIYRDNSSRLFPVKFYAPSFTDAQKIFIRQAVAALIVDDPEALENANILQMEGLSIEI